MSEEKVLPISACLFLIVVGLAADGLKFVLDYFLGIGLILDPFFITPITTLIFWIVHQHCGVRMFSGKAAAAAWINLGVSIVPGLDILPDWTAYAIYLTVMPRIKRGAQEVLSEQRV